MPSLETGEDGEPYAFAAEGPAYYRSPVPGLAAVQPFDAAPQAFTAVGFEVHYFRASAADDLELALWGYQREGVLRPPAPLHRFDRQHLATVGTPDVYRATFSELLRPETWSYFLRFGFLPASPGGRGARFGRVALQLRVSWYDGRRDPLLVLW